MKSRHFLFVVLFILLFFSGSSIYAHTISSSLGHSYSTVYIIIYFISSVLPFIGLGTLAKYPIGKIGYSRMISEFMAILVLGTILGYHFHNHLSTDFFNYFLTVGLGFLMVFYSGNGSSFIRVVILLSCLPIGFDIGSHFSHIDSWLGYMLSLGISSVAMLMGLSKLAGKLNDQFLWIQQSLGVMLVISGILLIILF